MITITPTATVYFNMLLSQQHKQYLYLNIKKSGCSGLEYVLSFENYVATNQKVVAVNGLLIIYDDKKEDLIFETHIDLIRQGINNSIIFRNTKETGRCGCGISFSAS